MQADSRSTGAEAPRGESVATRALFERRAVNAWCAFAAIGVVVPSVVDVYATSWHGGGRIFLALLLSFHLIYVPTLPLITATRGIVEAAAFAVLSLPIAEVLRQMGGAESLALLPVAATVFGAHVIGVFAGYLPSRSFHGAYLPFAVVIGVAWPLLGYAGSEFFGVRAGTPWQHGPMPWLVGWLDAPA